MVALLQVSDIEDVIGRPADDEIEERKWLLYIDSVSAYIENYVDVDFEKTENHVVRRKATYRGVVRLFGGPIYSVTAVKNWRTGQPDFYADWDGIDQIFNLDSMQVVDITYTHGYDTIPRDIFLVALHGVLGLVDEGEPSELRSYTVGDVKEDYRDSFFHKLFGELGMQTLNKYCVIDYTIDAGGDMRYPDYVSQGFLSAS